MGYNTTVVVLNDAIDFIENDPEFGKRLGAAIREASAYRKRVDVPAHSGKGGIHCNAASVIESHHADYNVFVRIGQNYGEVVDPIVPEDGTLMNWKPITDAEKIDGKHIICWARGWRHPLILMWKRNHRIANWHQQNDGAEYAEEYFGDIEEYDDYWLAEAANVPTHWLPYEPLPQGERE